MIQNSILPSKRHIQEEQYEFPYHYIPKWNNGRFSQVQYWSWGFRYLGGIQVVLDQLEKCSFNSLIDIGCGDGRFLRELAKRYPNAKLLGVDYYERAIQLARAMNPNLDFRTGNVIEECLSERFDVAVLIEVLEHIFPDQITLLLKAVANILNDNGLLIITVPHINKTVSEKHYQHFSSRHLRRLLDPYFKDFVFVPFDVKSKVMTILQRFIGGSGNHFVLTDSRLMSWFFQLYRKKYIYTDNEQKCLRIATLCRKR